MQNAVFNPNLLSHQILKIIYIISSNKPNILYILKEDKEYSQSDLKVLSDFNHSLNEMHQKHFQNMHLFFIVFINDMFVKMIVYINEGHGHRL